MGISSSSSASAFTDGLMRVKAWGGDAWVSSQPSDDQKRLDRYVAAAEALADETLADLGDVWKWAISKPNEFRLKEPLDELDNAVVEAVNTAFKNHRHIQLHVNKNPDGDNFPDFKRSLREVACLAFYKVMKRKRDCFRFSKEDSVFFGRTTKGVDPKRLTGTDWAIMVSRASTTETVKGEALTLSDMMMAGFKTIPEPEEGCSVVHLKQQLINSLSIPVIADVGIYEGGIEKRKWCDRLVSHPSPFEGPGSSEEYIIFMKYNRFSGGEGLREYTTGIHKLLPSFISNRYFFEVKRFDAARRFQQEIMVPYVSAIDLVIADVLAQAVAVVPKASQGKRVILHPKNLTGTPDCRIIDHLINQKLKEIVEATGGFTFWGGATIDNIVMGKWKKGFSDLCLSSLHASQSLLEKSKYAEKDRAFCSSTLSDLPPFVDLTAVNYALLKAGVKQARNHIHSNLPAPTLEEMENWGYRSAMDCRDNDLVVYTGKNDQIIHMGIAKKGQIKSKWGIAIFLHPIHQIPIQVEKILFMRKQTSPQKNRDD